MSFVNTAHNAHNAPLPKPLRAQLENTVKAARDVAEKAGRAALAQLAVSEAKAPDYLSAEQKALRRRLRAHGRALGDIKHLDDTQGVQHLVWEAAYEHWHRMLFARFLAESNLLMWEPGAAVSLDDCRDMVDNHPDMAMGAKSHWELAGKLAARMLPQVFKPDSPVFALAFAPEHQRELERLLAALATEVFQASDSLGWVYQFWQAQRKKEINESEVKIGADELPAVTQLFTEPYMVDFLLHNSLGAWWATRHPGKICPVPLPYLRTLEDGTPAAGQFEGWPNTLAEFKLLDPCCGSGHFLVAAFLLLVPMRMAAEGLPAMDAVDCVLQDNLHGLELDARCVEIAVFALALAAWRFPDENGDALGVRANMPAPHVACCGLKLAASADDWVALIPNALSNRELLAQDLRRLHADFAQSPLLGSLVSPSRSLKNDLATSNFAALSELLERALQAEAPATAAGAGSEHDEDARYLALTARGLMDAARLLEARYHLVITNVPYLARGKQNEALREYCDLNYPEAKADLANVFLARCLELIADKGRGFVQLVMTQNWLFLSGYKLQREILLRRFHISNIVKLGGGAEAFDSGPGNITNICLIGVRNPVGLSGENSLASRFIVGIDVSHKKNPAEKSEYLKIGILEKSNHLEQLDNPDLVISLEKLSASSMLSDYASSVEGLSTGDSGRFVMSFWEIASFSEWNFFAGVPKSSGIFDGLSNVLRWSSGSGELSRFESARIQGHKAWGKNGVLVGQMGYIPRCIYIGEIHDKITAALIPNLNDHLAAIWTYCSSDEYISALRRVNQKMSIATATLVQVPFDLAHWQQVAAERYPDGLPQPYSDDPTQWLFHGHPQAATDPLQVAVARLVGYRWPAELQTPPRAEFDAKSASSAYATSANSYQIDTHQPTETVPHSTAMELSSEAHAWIARCAPLAAHTDDDGIVCLPSVRGEPAAHDRLLRLLIAAWETVEPGSWKTGTLDKLLADADCTGKGLDVWLREKFFEQHAKRFHHRPFIWHVWDGLKDGFAALVNYHQLDAKNLERLIHTYLGDWIRQQEAGVANGTDGAALRMAAAQDLKTRLQAILDGEKPYDIFVRWKSLAEQPIGWTPDLNDGVRLNIRPFMSAEVLRHNKKPKLNITWDKDRGKDVESAPWFKVFGGDRINDHHLTLAEKVTAREKAKGN